MSAITTTIDRDQRDGLYELVRNHLGSIEDFWIALERTRDFAKAEALSLEFAEDFRLLQDIGWGDDEGGETFELTMPPRDLTELLKRLGGDAKRLLIESPSERTAIEDDEAVNERFQRGMEACTELLADLGSEERSAGVSGPNRRLRLSGATPPEINHVVLTEALSADPYPGRSPAGEPVTLLWIEFPVTDPAYPEALWARASCLAEVPDGHTTQDVKELRGGAGVLVWGQLSDRWVIENGHTSRRGVLVASLVKAGPSAAQLELSGSESSRGKPPVA